MSGFTINIESNASQLADAFRRGQTSVLQRADAAMARGGEELARDARSRAPKSTSQLTVAINRSRVGLLEHHVTAAKDYASYQEEGTGPGGQPTLGQMLDWIRRRGITARRPDMTARDLAFAIRRRIVKEGVPAQPFMRPALEATAPRLDALLRASLAIGINELGRRR